MTAPAITYQQESLLATLRAYISLTKPTIILMLLVTTVPAMVVAEGGWPGTWLVIATLVGGTLSAAGANTINCWYDRDIDKLMRRTRTRPLVTGQIQPASGLIFGISLGVGAFLFLAATTTLEAALLSLSALLFYVFIYTMWLKRRTAQNIVIGGAAGAFPPMVGWAAVTGDISLASVVMFAIVFMWTPPHFWALALKLKDDYASASVPMLPVTSGPAFTRNQILIYTIALVATTFTLIPASSNISWIYATTAALAGAGFIWYAVKLLRHHQTESPMNVYKYSLLYLAIIFVAIGVDGAI